MVISIKTVTTKKDLEKCFHIRKEVFIKEQKISEDIEFDDEITRQLILLHFMKKKSWERQGVATLKEGVKLERFAVLKSFRNLGVGKEILLFMLRYIKNG